MDRILKLLETREAQRPAAADEPAVQALTIARDKLQAEVDELSKQYTEFRMHNPFVLFKGTSGSSNFYAERLGRIESRRADLRIKRDEAQDQIARVEKAFDGGKDVASAQRLILGPKVADVAAEERERAAGAAVAQLKAQRGKLVTAFGEDHPAVKDVDAAVAL